MPYSIGDPNFHRCCYMHPDEMEESHLRWRPAARWNPYPPIHEVSFVYGDTWYKATRRIVGTPASVFQFNLAQYNLDGCPMYRMPVKAKSLKAGGLEGDFTRSCFFDELQLEAQPFSLRQNMMRQFPPLAQDAMTRVVAYPKRRHALRLGTHFTPAATSMDYVIYGVMPARILMYLEHDCNVSLSHMLLNFGARDGSLVDPLAIIVAWYGSEARGIYYDADSKMCSALSQFLDTSASGTSKVQALCPFLLNHRDPHTLDALRQVASESETGRSLVDAVKFDIDSQDCVLLPRQPIPFWMTQTIGGSFTCLPLMGRQCVFKREVILRIRVLIEVFLQAT